MTRDMTSGKPMKLILRFMIPLLFGNFYELLHLREDTHFLFLMAMTLVIIYILKNVYLIVMYDIQYRFTYNNQRRVAYKLMDAYMKQTYLFHVSRNISELT